MKLACRILGALMLIGAVVATVVGYWKDAGVPLAFMGVFWLFIMPMYFGCKTPPHADADPELSNDKTRS